MDERTNRWLTLNHCQVAQDILSQTILENKINDAIVCEQYKAILSGIWITDKSGEVAMWTCGSQALEEIKMILENDFMRSKIYGILIYSCYTTTLT